MSRKESKPLDIRIVVNDNLTRPNKFNYGDWIDLRNAEDIVLTAGDFRLIKLGVRMELPKGYEALVVPRSSTFKNYGILMVNSIGVIDNTYCGDNDEWMFPALATRNVIIPANTRICQFRLFKNQEWINFKVTDKLGLPDRGGIGSTGDK